MCGARSFLPRLARLAHPEPHQRRIRRLLSMAAEPLPQAGRIGGREHRAPPHPGAREPFRPGDPEVGHLRDLREIADARGHRPGRAQHVEWCAEPRALEPLEIARRQRPRFRHARNDRDGRRAPGESVHLPVEAGDRGQQDCRLSAAQPLRGAVEQCQRRAALEEERQVPEVAGERHLEQLRGLEVRDRVHPSARRAGIESLPDQTERQRERQESQQHAAVAGAPRLQRAEEAWLGIPSSRELRLEEEPEEQPREREGDAAATPMPASRRGEIHASPIRAAGSTVAKQIALKAAPPRRVRGSPTYHQSRSRRSSSSNKSQKRTLAAAQAIQSRTRLSGEAPWRIRTAPPSASKTPHQQIAKRQRSTCSDLLESSRVPATAVTPQTNLSTRANLPRKTRAPGPGKGTRRSRRAARTRYFWSDGGVVSGACAGFFPVFGFGALALFIAFLLALPI